MRSPTLLALVAAGTAFGVAHARTAEAREIAATGHYAAIIPATTATPPRHGRADGPPRRRTATSRETRSEAGPVQRALARLAGRVTTSDRDALRMAFRAYYNYRAAHPEHVRKPYLYFVDYGLDAETPRGYVFDMHELRVVEGPFRVAHGRGSAARGGVPRHFSNRHGSEATSLGLFLAQETYRFSGRSGGRRYTSVGVRLRGLSGRFNARARERGVVVHGAPYVTREGAGRSEGCPSVSPARARTLIPRIRNGGLVFLYSPHAPTWKREDPWVNHGRG
jgi:hypothetical protein